jgi:DnaJ-class molecular chaperone
MDDGTFTSDTEIRQEQTYVVCPDCQGTGVDTQNWTAVEFLWCRRCQGTGEIVN